MSQPCTGKGKSAGDANSQNQSIIKPETNADSVASQVNSSQAAQDAAGSSINLNRQSWFAEALYVYEEDAANDPYTSAGAHLGGAKEYRTLYIIGRIPELHNYPMPPALPHQTEYWKDEYWTQLNRFPTFVCKNQTNKTYEIPQSGDLIVVSFDDPELHIGANYLGLALDKKGQLRSHWGKSIDESKEVFNKEKETPSFAKKTNKFIETNTKIAQADGNDPKACLVSGLASPYKPRIPRIPAAKDGLYGAVCPLNLSLDQMAELYGPTGKRKDLSKEMVKVKFPFKVKDWQKGILSVHKKTELAWLMVFEDLKNDEDTKKYIFDRVNAWQWRCVSTRKWSGAPDGATFKDKNKESPTYGKTLQGKGCVDTRSGKVKPYPSGMSRHSWGTATDINPKRNPMQTEFVTDLPDSLVAIYKRYGFRWGGEFKDSDTMHFDFVGDPDLLFHAYEVGVRLGAPQFKNYPIDLAPVVAESETTDKTQEFIESVTGMDLGEG